MSFGVFLQGFRAGQAITEGGEAAAAVLRPFLLQTPDDGFAHITTDDGNADVHGIGSHGLMVDHASGHHVWQLLHDVATAARFAVMPVDCPTCVPFDAMLDDLPDELCGDAVVISSGQDLLTIIESSERSHPG